MLGSFFICYDTRCNLEQIQLQQIPILTYVAFAIIVIYFPRLWDEATLSRIYHHVDRESYVKANKPENSQPMIRILKHSMSAKKASEMKDSISDMSSKGGVNTLSYWVSFTVLQKIHTLLPRFQKSKRPQNIGFMREFRSTSAAAQIRKRKREETRTNVFRF